MERDTGVSGEGDEIARAAPCRIRCDWRSSNRGKQSSLAKAFAVIARSRHDSPAGPEYAYKEFTMNQIIAALIGAMSSIIVAIIGAKVAQRPGPARSARSAAGAPQSPSPDFTLPAINKIWRWACACVMVWIVTTPFILFSDVVAFNFLVVAIATLGLSAIKPIRPWSAAAIVLALHTVNLLMNPVSMVLNHDARWQYTRGHYGFDKPAVLAWALALAFGNALLAAAICHWRRQAAAPAETATIKNEPHHDNRATGDALPAKLERLAALHSQGKLSDDEFRTAKAHLLAKEP
jgi:hypothetical protein